MLYPMAYGQQTTNNINNYVPPSPNANSTVTALGSYNVNLYSGKLSYYAKLKEFTMAKVKMDLGLSYSTSGIKVQDLSGPEGLGWSMTLGGAITRYVAGLPDEAPNGYCGANRFGSKSYSAQNESYYTDILKGFGDSRPDRFYFSFLGYSGLFELDPDGNPVMQSSYGLKVLYSPFNRTNGRALGGKEDWVIADQAGNQYVLGDEYVDNSYVSSNGQETIKNIQYISAWYLKKVITADNQTISFDYLVGNGINFKNYVNVKKDAYKLSGSNVVVTTTTWDENATTYVGTLYLARISSPQFEVRLKYDLTRTDLPGALALTEVAAYGNNRLAWLYRFHYSYFVSSTGNEQRLKLDGISQESNKAYGVNYLYSFGYNTAVNLPPRNSLQTDYLGLYNSNPGTSNISGYQGGDKTPDPVRSAANILTSVTNNFGGITNFTYEQNSIGSTSATTAKGGLRIKKVATMLNGAEVGTELYDYTNPATGQSSGTELQEYQFSQSGLAENYMYSEPLSAVYDLSGVYIGYSYVTVKKLDGSAIRTRFTDASQYADYNSPYYNWNKAINIDATTNTPGPANFGDYINTSLAFCRGHVLAEEFLDNSNKVVKRNDYNYALSAKSGNIIGFTVLQNWTYYPGGVVFVGYDRRRFDFFTQDLQLISKTTTTNFYSGSTLTGAATENDTYTYSSIAPNLVATKSSMLSNGITAKTSMRYPFDVLTGTLSTTPPDPAYPMAYLIKNNIVGQPVEVLKSTIANSVENIASVSVQTYVASASGTVKPFMQYRANLPVTLAAGSYVKYQVTTGTGTETATMDSHLEPTTTSRYDAYGNLQTSSNPFTTTAGGKNSLGWAYNGNYLAAEIKNADYNEYYYQDFEDPSIANAVSGTAHSGNYFYSGTPLAVSWTPPNTRPYLISYWYRKNGTWNLRQGVTYTGKSTSPMSLNDGDAYDDIRVFPSDAQLTTSAYEPFVGMTGLIDPKGQTTVYQYDQFQRLQTIRDRNGNIAKNFVYKNVAPVTPFTNAAYNGTFTPANCGYNKVGVPMAYTVSAGVASSPYSQADANEQAKAYGQNYVNTNGGCVIKQVIFARVEYSNYNNTYYQQDQYNYSSQTTADVYVKFYQDAACQNPITLNVPIPIIISESENDQLAYGGTNPAASNWSFNVPAGVNAFFVGNEILYTSNSYTDPQSGYGSVTDTYEYSYDMTGNYTTPYTPLTTKK